MSLGVTAATSCRGTPICRATYPAVERRHYRDTWHVTPTSNVAARAGGAHHADGVPHGVGQLEVAVDEVADLQDWVT